MQVKFTIPVTTTNMDGSNLKRLKCMDQYIKNLEKNECCIEWGFELTTWVVIGTDCTCSYKSNYLDDPLLRQFSARKEHSVIFYWILNM